MCSYYTNLVYGDQMLKQIPGTQIRAISVARLLNLGLHNLCFCLFGNAPHLYRWSLTLKVKADKRNFISFVSYDTGALNKYLRQGKRLGLNFCPSFNEDKSTTGSRSRPCVLLECRLLCKKLKRQEQYMSGYLSVYLLT